MGVRLGKLAGHAGKRLKGLYCCRYGGVAAACLPNDTTIYGGKRFADNVYYARDRDIVEKAISEAAQA